MIMIVTELCHCVAHWAKGPERTLGPRQAPGQLSLAFQSMVKSMPNKVDEQESAMSFECFEGDIEVDSYWTPTKRMMELSFLAWMLL